MSDFHLLRVANSTIALVFFAHTILNLDFMDHSIERKEEKTAGKVSNARHERGIDNYRNSADRLGFSFAVNGREKNGKRGGAPAPSSLFFRKSKNTPNQKKNSHSPGRRAPS